TLFFVPTIIFLMIFVINMAALYESSLFAIPRSSLIYMIILWFLISTPLVFLGAYVCEKNYRQHKISHDSSVLISQIPKQRTGHLWYFQPMLRCIFGGIISFSALYVDMFYVIQSVWTEKYYYVSAILLVVLSISGMIMSITSIAVTHLDFYYEDYEWWWKSFYISFVSSVFMFIHMLYHYYTNSSLVITVPTVIYLGYSLITCAIYGLCMGTIGFFSSYCYVRNIYASIKVGF
ncbi:hypothetical protein INT47_003500, partial [Mucor saturninus]